MVAATFETSVGATPASLAALAAAQRSVADAEGDADMALAIVVEAALSVTPRAQGAAIELVEGDRLVYRAVSGVAAGHLGSSVSSKASLSGRCIAEARPLIAADCETDPRVDREACRRGGIRSMVVVPVFRRGHAVGALKLQAAEPSAFTEADAVLAQLLVGALGAGLADAAEREAARARAASDAALAERYAELEALYAGAPIGLAFIDRDLVYRRCNPHLAEINGLPASAHLGRSVRDVLPALADRLEPLFRHVLATGEPLRYIEIAGVTEAAPGTLRHCLASCEPVADRSGAIIGVNVAVVETTSQKTAENFARRQARMLAESELRYRTLVRATSTVTWVRSPSGLSVEPQPEWMAFTGQTAEETSGDGWARAVHPDDVAATTSAWRDAVARSEPFRHEHRVRRNDGEWRWMSAHAVPLQGLGGERAGWFGMHVDITERKHAEAALAASEAQFRTTAEALPGLLFVTSPEGHNTYVNEGFRTFTGRSNDELLGDRWQKALHPDDAARAMAIWAEAVRSGKPYEAEYRVRRRDGALRWHAARGLPIRGEDGAVLQWVGCCVDIHERRQTEEELQRKIADALAERRLWAEIVEASDAFIQVLDPELRILAINRSSVAEMERVFGVRLRPGDRLDDALRDHPRALEELSALWRRALAGEFYTHVGQYGDATRDKRWYEMKFSPLASAEGRLMGALRISYDVTDRLREQRALADTAEELRRANARLRAEMKRREEAQAALLQAQKLEALGQLTSGVAHDFNNVTQAVAFGFEIIEKRANDPKIAEIARHGAAAALRGGQLVRQMLAFARKQELAPKRIDLGRQLEETWPLLARTLGPLVELKVERPEGDLPVRVDPALLETALINLAANARDAMPEGGALVFRVRESLAGEPHRPPELDDRPAMAISVSDTGCGISPTVLHRVLEPFFTTKGIGKGTGLGLSMVHGFTVQSGGALRIESREGQGTTVTLYLPIDDAPAAAHPEPAASTPGAGAPPALTILLVDDDEVVRSLIAAQLEAFGHSVVQADGAESALAALHANPIDLVVSDVLMPRESGPTLAAKLRERRPELPVLFITGRSDQDGLVGERVLDKPFTPDALREAITATLAAAQNDDGPALDRLAKRFKADGLRQLLAQWRAARGGGQAPRFDAFDPTSFHRTDKLIVVETDAAHAPLRFRVASVGADLEAALGRPLAGADLPVTGDDEAGSLEASYRRCVLTGKPVYDYARFASGDGPPDTLERLVTPWSTDGRAVDRLVAMAVVAGPAFDARKQSGESR